MAARRLSRRHGHGMEDIFTMSLFIAGEAFPDSDFTAARIAVFAASTLSAAIGVAALWSALRDEPAAGSGPRRARHADTMYAA